MRVDLPGKSNATAVSQAVPKDLARHDLVGLEDCNELLSTVSVMINFRTKREETDRLCNRFRQVGDVQVGRLFVSLSLETSVEALTCEANLVAEEVEGLNTFLGVTDMLELGKAESE